MTPGARVAAAIEVLDTWLSGMPAEQALTRWARANRFAGSGDRAAIRDHVFDAVRCRRSFAALGGAETGRGLMIGAIRASGGDPAELFDGSGHAPAPLSGAESEAVAALEGLPAPVRLDVPDWVYDAVARSLGERADPVLAAMRSRAPVFLRVNSAKTNRDGARAALAADGVAAEPHPLSPTALEVTDGARRVRQTAAYRDGWVELQDAASQAVVDALLPVPRDARVLDYCAGGGGKALAIAAAGGGRVFAHDADPSRMADLPARAARAGADVVIADRRTLSREPPFDLVLVDAPCSGSGAWRRQPDAKWRLTEESLADLTRLQVDVLCEAARYAKPGGVLAYATCSILRDENADVVAAFRQGQPGWDLLGQRQLTPLDGGDGFFVATMRREA